MKLSGLDPFTHKPIEPEENFIEEKRDTSILELNKLEEQPQNSLEAAKNMQNFDHVKKESFSESVDDETNDILKNYEMINGRLDFGILMNQEVNNSNFSFSYKSSTSESHPLHFLSWGNFNNFEQDLFSFGN